MPSLKSLNLSICRIIAFLLLIHYFTPWPWPSTFDLEHLQRITCDVMKLCTTFERNRAICGGVIAISVFDLMTLNIALRVALGCGIIFTKFDFRQLTHAWLNSVFFDADTLCHAVTLTFDSLTLKVCGTSNVMWSKSRRNLSEIEQSSAELLIILRIFAHVMLRPDLYLWPLDL